MLGTFFQAPFTFSYSNTRGIVCSIIAQVPQEDPAQLAIQSAQSISCSAPRTSVPFPLEGAGAAAAVVDDVSVLAPPFEPLELPQAARTIAAMVAAATMERRVRITRDLPVSRESGWSCQLQEPCEVNRPAAPAAPCESEDDRRDHRDPVEVLLDGRGSRHRSAQRTAAEHVRETATTTRVEQHQEDQSCRDGEVE